MSSFSSELGVKFSIQLEANHVINKSQVGQARCALLVPYRTDVIDMTDSQSWLIVNQRSTYALLNFVRNVLTTQSVQLANTACSRTNVRACWDETENGHL